MEQLTLTKLRLRGEKITGQHFALFTTSFRFVLDGFRIEHESPQILDLQFDPGRDEDNRVLHQVTFCVGNFGVKV